VPQGPALPGPIAWAPDNRGYGTILRKTRLASLLASRAIARVVRPPVERADVVHVHGNGLLAEMGARVAGPARKPVVLTLYGTEIWHYRPRRFVDLFTHAYHRAGSVTFYSRGLLERARELGLGRDGMTVIYPPVASHFTRLSEPDRAALRRKLGLAAANVLVNVKRLHPLAGHRYFLEAMPQVLRTHPDTHVVICGSGPLHEELEQLASRLRIANRVTFTGLLENATVAEYCAAADAFVLPSLLEALPTVAVEALACGTRVVSADHPGGLELQGLFGDDVTVVPRRDISALASAIEGVLMDGRRAAPESEACLQREFHPTAVWSRYEAVYEKVVERGARR
jgi:phosphatidylinositol alpha-1,6-mannosyltransferase